MSEYVFSPDVFFVGRNKELLELDSVLQREKVCIIQGSSGIGKSALVNHFLHRYKKIASEKMLLTDFDEFRLQVHKWKDIRSKEIIAIDDIDDILMFLNSTFCLELLEMPVKSIILITRDQSRVSVFSSINVEPLTIKESSLLINCIFQEEIKESDKQELIRLSNGIPLLLYILVYLYKDYSISINDITYQWSLPENKELIFSILQKDYLKKVVQLDEEELIVLQNLSILGEIGAERFLRWSTNERSEENVHTLIKKGILCLTPDGTLRINAGYHDFSGVEYDTYKNIADSILCDIKRGVAVDEKYPERIIECIKKNDDAASFVADYYHLKYNDNEKSEVYNILRMIASDVKDVKKTTMDIGLTVKETNMTVTYIDQKTNDFYGFLCIILDELQTISSEDTDVLEKLEELKEYVLNPEKGVRDEAFAIIGFLGSVASIVNSPQGLMLLNILNKLFRLLLNTM